MDDKRIRDPFNPISEHELSFTKEDRNKVFEKINLMEKSHQPEKKTFVSISKQLSIVTASLAVVGLCLVLFLPAIFQGNFTNETNGSTASGVSSEEGEYVTTLLMVKDENNRIPVTLLHTYSKNKKRMKVLSIPRDTYVPIDKKDGTASYDKLTFAYEYGSGAESVRTTVSKLFDLPIDYYAVMDLATFTSLIGSVNGIEYDLPEDLQLRAISRVSFDFKKGTNRLSGEEVVALMMAATDGRKLDEENQLNLIHAVINQTINELPQSKLNEYTAKVGGDFPIEQMLENKNELPSIQSVSLLDGMTDAMIDEKYYITFEKAFLTSVSEELTTFN